MYTVVIRVTAATALVVALADPVTGQTIDALGTRAAGMSGAFVAVSDDASAAYWNPAGFASGSFFSLTLDRTASEADPGGDRAGSQSGWLLAFGAPALGVSYYRLRATRMTAIPTAQSDDDRNLPRTDDMRLTTLVSHHVGGTLVQSLVQGVAVGATLKVVRGMAATEVLAVTGDRDDLLDEGSSLPSRGSTQFDLDVGVMAAFGAFKAGVTVRNVTEPSFATPGDEAELSLERQARAGVSVSPYEGWQVAADVDLLRTRSVTGEDRRDMAIGVEGRVARRVFVRGGTRFDTRGDGPGGHSATASIGGSYAVLGGVLIDGQFTSGSKWAGRGWGVAARFVY
jgi:hypothetical protein